jgi:hypothetical protein
MCHNGRSHLASILLSHVLQQVWYLVVLAMGWWTDYRSNNVMLSASPIKVWNGFDGFWQNGCFLETLANFHLYANNTRFESVLNASYRELYQLEQGYAPWPSYDDMAWFGISYARIYEVTGWAGTYFTPYNRLLLCVSTVRYGHQQSLITCRWACLWLANHDVIIIFQWTIYIDLSVMYRNASLTGLFLYLLWRIK